MYCTRLCIMGNIAHGHHYIHLLTTPLHNISHSVLTAVLYHHNSSILPQYGTSIILAVYYNSMVLVLHYNSMVLVLY